ncbi:MAG: FG-GAP repeat protein, partial [Planctomycetota bacterium]
DAAASDFFGVSVALSGDTAVIGAVYDDDNGYASGSAYVFVEPAGGWDSVQSPVHEVAKLTASAGEASDRFGRSVAISGDTVVSGAYNDRADTWAITGSAYVFEKPPTGWESMTETVKLTASDGEAIDMFGWSVGVSGDTIVVGAPWNEIAYGNPTGAAYVFMEPGGGWASPPSVPMNEHSKLNASDAQGGDVFGSAVAITGDSTVIGAVFDDDNGIDSGSAYVVGGLSDCNTNGTLDICDIADGTSEDDNANGVPDECEGPVPLDVRPGACPNPLNRSGRGVLPVAVVGTASLDVMMIDVSSVRLSRADGTGGEAAPNEGPPGPHSVFEDVATPSGGQACECHDLPGDGTDDLSMKFRTDEVVQALDLGNLANGDELELVVTGQLIDGTEFTSAGDCILIVAPGAPPGILSVESTVAGAWIDVSPPDEVLDAGGFANFERSFPVGTVVTLTAEPQVDGRPFIEWLVNGPVPSAGQSNVPGGFANRSTAECTVQVTIVENKTVRAVYGPSFSPTVGPSVQQPLPGIGTGGN